MEKLCKEYSSKFSQGDAYSIAHYVIIGWMFTAFISNVVFKRSVRLSALQTGLVLYINVDVLYRFIGTGCTFVLMASFAFLHVLLV